MMQLRRTDAFSFLIFGVSALGSLTVSIRVGISLSSMLTFAITLATLLLIIVAKRVPKSVLVVFVPSLSLASLSLVHDVTNSSLGRYHPENITLVLFATTFSILLPSLLMRKQRNVVNSYFGGLELATTIYLIAAVFVWLLKDEEPAFAIAGIPIYAFHLASFMVTGNRKSFAILVFLIMISVLMESRIVLLAQLLLGAYAATFSKNIGYKIKLAVLAAICSFVTVFVFSARFGEFVGGGDQALELGGVAVNTSGRLFYWQIIFASALNHPFLGSGFSVPESLFTVRNWSHPHNDYLRLFHKFGLLGLLIWFWFIASYCWGFRRLNRNLRAPYVGNDVRILERTAMFSVLGLLIVMMTDNPMAYPYIMLPVAYLIGASPVLSRQYDSLPGSAFSVNLSKVH